MPRLIDADELIKKLEFNSWDIDEWELPHEQVSAGLRANAYDRKTVEDAPTIDAIPVNWIIKWSAEHMEDYGTITISKMLEDWKNDKANRKE